MVINAIGIVVVLLILVGLLNIRALKRFFTAASAQVGKAGRWAETKDPVAVYQDKIDAETGKLKTATEGLTEIKGLMNAEQRQIEEQQHEAARLDVRIKTAIASNNDAKGAEYAQELAQCNAKIAKYKTSLATHTDAYNGFLRQVKAAEENIRNAKQEAASLGAELKISQAEALLAETSEKLQVDSNLTSLNPYKEEIQKQIDQNKAKGQVIHDLNADRLAALDEEEKLRQAEGKALLEKYKAEHQQTTQATNQ